MRIRNIAHEMNIGKLLCKVSVGDMVATEAKYHCTCLIEFYNSYQKHNKDKREQANEQLMEGIAFSKVLEFIEESILASDETTTPVFYLKELTEMYKKHLIAQGATETANSVHQTGLKNTILENVPGLCATKSGKHVLLTLYGELGRALFNACLSCCSDDGILLAKAAIIIRKDLRHEQQFNGDTSRERQFEGIPSSIFQLISLIIEAGYTQDSTPECSEKIIGNVQYCKE